MIKTASERKVSHLRLRASNETDVRRTVIKLEDALRCASLPDAESRLLLVRHLALGIIAPDATSQTLSQLLAQRVAAANAIWVHGAQTNAIGADFVYFRDTLEARSELAVRLTRSLPCEAWYWPLAVPEFIRALGSAENLRRIALAIAALPEAPAALPAWIARLVAAGAAHALAQAVAPGETAVLLRAASLPAALTAAPDAANNARDALPTQWQTHSEDAPHVADRIASEEFPAWLRTLALRGGFVAAVAHNTRVATVTRSQEPGYSLPSAGHEPRRAIASALVPQGAAQPQRLAATRNAWDAGSPPALDNEADISTDSPQAESKLPVVNLEAQLAPQRADHHPLAQFETTACGGLLFLLPVMQRLGFETWCDPLPEGTGVAVSRCVLAHALRGVGAIDDDPAWYLAAPAQAETSVDIRSQAPSSWADPVLRPPGKASQPTLALQLAQAYSIETLAHVWLRACRRWLRRAAGIGVASLVLRPANLQLTATHADLLFDLGAADLRVRRAGLDIDPGWLPWFGCVVAFHYGAREP